MATTSTEQQIAIPYPEAHEVTLVLRMGPCRVRFTPSDGPDWVSGTYEDPTGALPLQVRAGPTTLLSQAFEPLSFTGMVMPRLDLAIARDRPFGLEIQAGASENTFELGGLPLTRLAVKAGAGRYDLDFATPNPTAMTTFELSAGAGAITARHLANANFTTLRFGGGVAACTLDFGGQLLHDATARIDAGLGSVDITVPALMPVRVVTKAFASARRTSGAFVSQGETYYTQPGLQGAHPLLDIEVSLAFGSLNLAAT
jgi:hypothetical protein